MNWEIGFFLVVIVVIVFAFFSANRMSEIEKRIEDDEQMKFLKEYKERKKNK